MLLGNSDTNLDSSSVRKRLPRRNTQRRSQRSFRFVPFLGLCITALGLELVALFLACLYRLCVQ